MKITLTYIEDKSMNQGCNWLIESQVTIGESFITGSCPCSTKYLSEVVSKMIHEVMG